jgi:hypothetical protein
MVIVEVVVRTLEALLLSQVRILFCPFPLGQRKNPRRNIVSFS